MRDKFDINLALVMSFLRLARINRTPSALSKKIMRAHVTQVRRVQSFTSDRPHFDVTVEVVAFLKVTAQSAA